MSFRFKSAADSHYNLVLRILYKYLSSYKYVCILLTRMFYRPILFSFVSLRCVKIRVIVSFNADLEKKILFNRSNNNVSIVSALRKRKIKKKNYCTLHFIINIYISFVCKSKLRSVFIIQIWAECSYYLKTTWPISLRARNRVGGPKTSPSTDPWTATRRDRQSCAASSTFYAASDCRDGCRPNLFSLKITPTDKIFKKKT